MQHDLACDDVRGGWGVAGILFERKQPRIREQQQRSSVVCRIVGNGNDVAFFDFIHAGGGFGEQVHGDDKGGSEYGQVIAACGELVAEISVMLESVEIDIPAGKRIVRNRKIRILNELYVDAFFFELGDGGCPDVLINRACHADFNGIGFRFSAGSENAANNYECEKCRCQSDNGFHDKFPLFIE